MVLLYAFTLPKEDKCSICILNVPSIRPRDQLLRLLRLPPTEKMIPFSSAKTIKLEGAVKEVTLCAKLFSKI